MLYKQFEIGDKTVGIWKISESMDELLCLANLGDEFRVGILSLHSEKRKIEKLATCCLLRELGLDYSQLAYLPSGKPELKGKNLNISISHTACFVAIALSPSPVGIDIESIDARIVKLWERFVSGDEFIDSNSEIIHLMLHWSAKEAMFKWIGREEVLFREQLYVMPFSPAAKGYFQVNETKTEMQMAATAYYEIDERFVLVVLG